MNESEPLLYSIERGGVKLGHGRSWAYGEVAAGRLRPVEVNGRMMLTAAELRRYVEALEECTQGQAS